jgi:hypothetical protein
MTPAVRRWRWGCQLPRRAFGGAVGDQSCGASTPRTGAPILWDRWKATNPHALIIAESGSGKTYMTSGLLAQELAPSEDAVLLLDRA